MSVEFKKSFSLSFSDIVSLTCFFRQNSLNLASFAFSFGARVVRTALVAAVAITVGVTFGAGFFVGAFTTDMYYSRRISNRAAIKAVGVGVYQDLELTVSLTGIDWGILEPGEEKNHTAYIKNESNVARASVVKHRTILISSFIEVGESSKVTVSCFSHISTISERRRC